MKSLLIACILMLGASSVSAQEVCKKGDGSCGATPVRTVAKVTAQVAHKACSKVCCTAKKVRCCNKTRRRCRRHCR